MHPSKIMRHSAFKEELKGSEMSKITKASLDAVYAYLAAKSGARLCCQQISIHFGWTNAYTSEALSALTKSERIQTSTFTRNRTFYVPAEGERTDAPAAHTPMKSPPLKVDKHRLELYRELAAARLAIPSIG